MYITLKVTYKTIFISYVYEVEFEVAPTHMFVKKTRSLKHQTITKDKSTLAMK